MINFADNNGKQTLVTIPNKLNIKILINADLCSLPYFLYTFFKFLKVSFTVSTPILIIPQEIRFEDYNATVLETARKFFDGTETHLRSSLAKFLFYGENVFKRVGKLSGGEKVRLKLFELIQKKA